LFFISSIICGGLTGLGVIVMKRKKQIQPKRNTVDKQKKTDSQNNASYSEISEKIDRLVEQK
jgi:hypothetical protein